MIAIPGWAILGYAIIGFGVFIGVGIWAYRDADLLDAGLIFASIIGIMAGLFWPILLIMAVLAGIIYGANEVVDGIQWKLRK